MKKSNSDGKFCSTISLNGGTKILRQKLSCVQTTNKLRASYLPFFMLSSSTLLIFLHYLFKKKNIVAIIFFG